MKAVAFLLSLLLFLPQTAAAQSSSDRLEREASVVFWNFATCVVERYPDDIRKLLAKPNWEEGEQNHARALAQRSVDPNTDRKEPCGFFETLRFNSELFRGTLAGAMFVRDTKGGPLADFKTVQSPVTAADLAAGNDAATQLQLGLKAFSYCVFLNKPDDVRALLITRPFSKAEDIVFGSLASTFGGCLPAKDGTRISFTRVRLRALLGEAAYYANSSLSSRASTGKSQ
ncbi:MAG: hypothetical protein KA233_00730 [Novosphingobium sp.]|nr:hypothetical protein [Novosphingobium sp.]MBP6554185.1 hypothetical protein [Novosphingobium sp.]